jgi:hypothetical protein
MRREWTNEEIHRLKLLADGKVSADYIAKSLKRSVTSVKAKAQWLNLSLTRRLKVKEDAAALAHKFWTPEEDNRLRMFLGAGKTIKFAAAELKRSAAAVKSRAYILRISLKPVMLKKAKEK